MTRIETWDNPELNLELFFCTEVLDLDSLHYGYWEQEEKLDLNSIRQAQQRYTDTLLEMVPEDVHSILDIGCGIGDNAKALAAHGYEVTCISPDHIHAAYFKDVKTENIHFINTSIENFSSQQTYDLVLMSESQGYFAMDMGFSQSVRYLRPGGYLLVSGIFKQDNGVGFEGSHIESKYIQCAQNFCLEKQNYIDITENVLPTLKFAFDNYNNYLNPLMETLNHFIGKSGQLKVRLLKTLFAQELQNFDVVREFYEERFNPMLFRENMRYTRLLFKFLPNAYDSELLKKRIEKPLVSAIICAYNEERTLLSNLKSLADCELVDEVIVVNDGSSDQTGQQIQSLTDDGKVKAIHFPQNMGKSQAMVTAALRAHGDILVFIDADLTDLNSRHIQTLIQPLRKHEADMVIGDARDKKSFIKSLDPFRSLSGERAVWRQDLLPLAEEIRDSGYGIETLLNLGYKEAHKNVCYRDLEGLSHPWKVEKFNPLKATHEYLREGSQIMRALIKRSSNRNLPAN
jgi:SAM-dependent methyltransferase